MEYVHYNNKEKERNTQNQTEPPTKSTAYENKNNKNERTKKQSYVQRNDYQQYCTVPFPRLPKENKQQISRFKKALMQDSQHNISTTIQSQKEKTR